VRNVRALNYFGSKVASAHRYPAPKYPVVIEPFAGGAGYSLLHSSKCILLSDTNPDVVDAWQYLIGAGPEEIRALPLLAPGQDVRELGLPRGPTLLIAWCTNLTAHPSWRLSSWGEKHFARSACFWGPRRREQMARVAGRVKHWSVRCASYEECRDSEATWFVDPPYQASGHRYPHASIDYAALAQWCRTRRGQVIVCETEGADWLPFWRLRTGTAARACPVGGGTRRRYLELIWTNEREQLPLAAAAHRMGVLV
jgi:site-specific DNA-adenine methylase